MLVLLASRGLRAARGVWGHAPPRKILDFRSSEIVSDAFVNVIASYILRWRCMAQWFVHQRVKR